MASFRAQNGIQDSSMNLRERLCLIVFLSAGLSGLPKVACAQANSDLPDSPSQAAFYKHRDDPGFVALLAQRFSS
jgi:hypothetical protein